MPLRLAHLRITPVLVWDDGDSILPGPELNEVAVPLSGLGELAERLPAEVAALAEKMAEQDDADTST